VTTLRSVAAAWLLLVLAAPSHAAGDPAAGKRKTVTCNGCHGQAGMKSMPSLGGQRPDYFVAAMEAYQDGVRLHPTMRDVAKAFSLRDYRDGVRKHAIMGVQAVGLSDDDIAALSAYFSAQPGLFVK
jgi:cytochrome c553